MKLTSFTAFICIVFSLFACSRTTPNTNEPKPITPETAPIVGADADEHGCKASAGYQWSVLKKECIRIFESGTRLDAQAPGLDKTMSAFVVFKSETDDTQAEIFMPGSKTSLLFDKVAIKDDAGTWKHDTFTLSQWKGMYMLNGAHQQVLYQGHGH